MLSNAADYRYLTPLAAGIHGGILPAVDGQAAASVVAYEDYCHLVEMARERDHWSFSTQRTPIPASNFNSQSLVAERDTLDALTRCWDIGFDTNSDGALIPSNWNHSDFPIIKSLSDTPRYAHDAFRATAAYSHILSGLTVPCTVETNTLRYLYREYGDMKRYMFYSGATALNESEFAALSDWSRYRQLVGPVQIGDRTIVDGSTTTTDPSAAYPWYEASLSSYGSITYQTRSDSTLRYYIRTPFLLNPLTETAYYQSMPAYIGYAGEVSWNYSRYSYTAIFPLPVSLVATVSSGLAGADGYVTLDVLGPTINQHWSQVKSWWELHKPADADPSSIITYLGLQMYGIYLDTGVVTHNTALPSSWTWQPANVT